jgi:septum site-determining protein MinD
VVTASNQGLPVALNPRSKAGKSFREIAQRLMGEEVPLVDLDSSDGFIRRISRLVRQGGR